MRLIAFFILFSHLVLAQQELTHDVYFNTDEYNIPSTEENRLLLFISKLEHVNIKSIAIYGFCDDRGTDNYNLVLSQQRADAIKMLFSNNEISETLITNVDGKGEILLKIVHEKDISKIRGLNRKVEIIVSAKSNNKEVVTIVKEEKKSTPKILEGNLKIGDKVRFENVSFKNGHSSINKDSKKILDAIAKVLKEREDIYFTVQGHVCCTQNSRDAVDIRTKKRTLSVNRAKNVYNYLAKKGVNKKRMKYVGLRRLFPLGGDPKLDRRVEILITHVNESN